jgi:hypothetical protein
MPTVTFSKHYDASPTVVRRAYEWYFPEEMQQIEHNPEFYENTFCAGNISQQLEMFPQQAAIEDYFFFKLLVDQWRSECGATSSTSEIVLSSAYQSIIGMGPKAIPFILSELASEGDDPDHWFWALQVLTRSNPVTEADEGNLPRMAKAWLDWAESEGYAR